MEVHQVIDPDRLDPAARAVWDKTFPGGFWAGAPHKEGPYFRLWSYAYICQTFELGYVPEVVDEVLRPEDYAAIGGYWAAMRKKRTLDQASES
jgi:hypothetical protein